MMSYSLLFSDDVDTELYRLLAAKAMSVGKTDKSKRSNSAWSAKQNGGPNATLAPFAEVYVVFMIV